MSKQDVSSKRKGKVKEVEVDPEFYEIFSEDDVVSIINDLQFKRLIKHKYNYYYKGASAWDEFYFTSPLTKVIDEMKPAILQNLLYFLGNSHSCNIVDIGPGNAYPVKNWLETLVEIGVMNTYVAGDISDDINSIVEKNIKEWFPTINFKKYVKDIELGEMAGIFIESKMGKPEQETKISNIVLHFGSTMCNHDDRLDALKNMSKSMDTQDLLAFSFTTDSDSNKISHKYVSNQPGENVHGWMPQILGLNYDLRYVQTLYDPKLNARVKSLTLDSNYIVNFKIFGGNKKIELRKGERIDLWRHYLIGYDTLMREIDDAGLEALLIHYDKTKSYAIAVCRIKDMYNQRG